MSKSIVGRGYRCVDCKFFRSSVAYCIRKRSPVSYLSSPCEEFEFAKRLRFP